MFRLQAKIKQAAERLLFLLDYALLPEEDIKLNNQTFNWPGRMEPIFEVSQQRLAARREKAENEVKERSVSMKLEEKLPFLPNSAQKGMFYDLKRKNLGYMVIEFV